MTERIIIRSKGGKWSMKTEGYVGAACAAATRGLEQRLGVKVADAPTEEMYAGTVDHTEELHN